MRATSVIKLMVGWFLAAAGLGAAGFYVLRPIMLEAQNEPKAEGVVKDEDGEVVSKRFSAPKLTVSSTRASIRRGGSTVGKRPRRPKKVAPTTENAPAPDAGGAAPSAPDTGAPPTVIPVDGGGAGTTTPVSGGG